MNRLALIALSSVLALSLTACGQQGGTKPEANSAPTNATTNQNAGENAQPAQPAQQPAEQPAQQ